MRRIVLLLGFLLPLTSTFAQDTLIGKFNYCDLNIPVQDYSFTIGGMEFTSDSTGAFSFIGEFTTQMLQKFYLDGIELSLGKNFMDICLMGNGEIQISKGIVTRSINDREPTGVLLPVRGL